MSTSSAAQKKSETAPAGADATLAWEQLTAQVDRLIASWERGGDPPDLAQFMPAEPPELRRMLLTELIKVDLEYRWQHMRAPKTIEEYLAEFPELSVDGHVPRDVIYEEYHVRRMSPAPPDPSDYLRRFPKQVEQLRRMFTIQPGQTTTMAVGNRRPPVDVGKQIDDFDVLLRLGEGAFASVYLARQRSMQRMVALKVSRDRGSEPQTLAQLDHPHIVRVYDQRILVEQRLRLMYMQHIPGGTLQDVIRHAKTTPPATWNGLTLLAAIDGCLEKNGETPPLESATRRRLGGARWAEAICWLGARLAAALDYAHRRGVLHRDVKPANVLLTAEASPKLADFNVSFSSKLDGATPAAYFGGSLAYMSPEQLEASDPDHPRQPEELDGRSDVYSLAVMLWELLTGSRPFGDESVFASMAETLKRLAEVRRAGIPASVIAALPRDLPPGLEQVLQACLAPEVKDRPATAAVMARQLELCLQPRAQRLFRPEAKSFRQKLRDRPIASFVAAGAFPHAVFSLINIVANFYLIISHLGDQAVSLFERQIAAVNGGAYAIGISVGVYLIWPVVKAIRGYKVGIAPEPSTLPQLRRTTLINGDVIACLGFSLWIVSAFVFPTWLNAAGLLRAEDAKYYWYFFMSQVICGLIASTQTFFMIAFVSVRGFYPLLIPTEKANYEEIGKLRRLDRRLFGYLGLAFVAPVLAGVVILLIDIPGTKWLTSALLLIGAVSSILLFYMLKVIQADLATLVSAIDPEGAASPTGGLDSVDSFWTSSRLSG